MEGKISYGVIEKVLWGVVGFMVGVIIEEKIDFKDIKIKK